jgi:hypothetical protein
MICAIDMVAVPISVTCVLTCAAIIIGVALYDRHRAQQRRQLQLPHGADAALWSITEVLPDPRNHLSIKDPTSELRLTEAERLEAAATAEANRRRAETSPDRPAQRAAAEQSLEARKAALAKHEELAREKQRRALADRDPAAFSSPEVVDRLEALRAETIDLRAATDPDEAAGPQPATDRDTHRAAS